MSSVKTRDLNAISDSRASLSRAFSNLYGVITLCTDNQLFFDFSFIIFHPRLIVPVHNSHVDVSMTIWFYRNDPFKLLWLNLHWLEICRSNIYSIWNKLSYKFDIFDFPRTDYRCSLNKYQFFIDKWKTSNILQALDVDL